MALYDLDHQPKIGVKTAKDKAFFSEVANLWYNRTTLKCEPNVIGLKSLPLSIGKEDFIIFYNHEKAFIRQTKNEIHWFETQLGETDDH